MINKKILLAGLLVFILQGCSKNLLIPVNETKQEIKKPSNEVVWDGRIKWEKGNILTINNLHWQDDNKNKSILYHYNSAKKYCSSLNTNELYWRLPTKKELFDAHEKNNYFKTLNDGYYISSDKSLVNIKFGGSSNRLNTKYYVKCVTDNYKYLDENKELIELTNYFVKQEFDKITPQKKLAKPKEPTITNAEALVKGRFEKTVDFQKRVQREKEKREAYITKLENKYKKEIL